MSPADGSVKVYEPDNSIKKGYGSIISEIIREIRDSRWLTYQLFKRDFTALYKQSFVGMLWVFLVPIFSVSTFIVLNRAGIFQIGQMDAPYPLFAVLGLSFWQFFSAGLMASTGSLVEAGQMIKIINFSKKSLVIAATGRALVSFLVQLGLAACLMVWFRYMPHMECLWIPVVFIPLIFFTWGLGFIMSLLNAVMRDIGNILSMLMTFLMFLTPILYMKPQAGMLKTISELNPLYYLINAPRDLVLYGRLLEPTGFVYSTIFSFVLFFLCLILFHLTETRIAERV